MVMPSFSALLTHSTFQFLSNSTPIFSAILAYQLDKLLIFLFCLNQKIFTHDPLTIADWLYISFTSFSFKSFWSTNFSVMRFLFLVSELRLEVKPLSAYFSLENPSCWPEALLFSRSTSFLPMSPHCCN